MSKPLKKLPLALTSSTHPARLWTAMPEGRVRCHLSPRECNIPAGGVGFCGVRHNLDGKLVTLNYGKSVAMTQENIEVEAVFHYAPGARILSLGNIGCMMACDFCHNWQTSQARLARDTDIHVYTSEQIVDYALRHNIKILSWTYNDPVVWHEFVVDTARLARKHGIKNLFKSAFYIGPQAVEELLEVIDIFSLSLKSMDAEFYRKHTKGRLEPVLDAIKQVYAASKLLGGPHLELSNLCVSGRNDNLEDAAKTARWMLEHLDAEVPLHYVRFHPDYKYTHVERTDVAFLEGARLAAKALGLHHVYLGNVLETASINTLCAGCGELLIERRGTLTISGAASANCSACGTASPVLLPWPSDEATEPSAPSQNPQTLSLHVFSDDVSALHIEQEREAPVSFVFIDAYGQEIGARQSSSCTRFLISKPHSEAKAVQILYAEGEVPRVYEVLDRAHFPTVTQAGSDSI